MSAVDVLLENYLFLYSKLWKWKGSTWRRYARDMQI